MEDQISERILRRRSWAEIIRESLRVYRRGFAPMLFLALLSAIPSFFFQQLVPFELPSADHPTFQLPHLTRGAFMWLALLIALWPISVAGLQVCADGVLRGERIRLMQLLRNAVRLWPRVIAAGLIVYVCFAFWIIVPFSAMFSVSSAEPSLLTFFLVLAIGIFTIYITTRLLINFLFWQQTAALTDLPPLAALRESKALARSRPNDSPLARPLYRGGIVLSVWLLLVIGVTIAVQVPFVAARFIGVSDPTQALELANRLANTPQSDALTMTANAISAFVHAALRPLLAASFVVLYYDARADRSAD